jgi:hypothetical protein
MGACPPRRRRAHDDTNSCHCEERSDEAIYSDRFASTRDDNGVDHFAGAYDDNGVDRFTGTCLPRRRRAHDDTNSCHCEERSDEAIYSDRFASTRDDNGVDRFAGTCLPRRRRARDDRNNCHCEERSDEAIYSDRFTGTSEDINIVIVKSEMRLFCSCQTIRGDVYLKIS